MEETIFPLQSVTKVIGVEKIDSTQTVAQALASCGEKEGTLVLACEQMHTFFVRKKWISSGEGGIYFSLLLREDVSPKVAVKIMGQALSETLLSGLDIEICMKEEQIFARGQKANGWKCVGTISACTLPTKKTLLNVGFLLNNLAPRVLAKQYTSIKKMTGCETSKELFLEALLDAFWKQLAWA